MVTSKWFSLTFQSETTVVETFGLIGVPKSYSDETKEKENEMKKTDVTKSSRRNVIKVSKLLTLGVLVVSLVGRTAKHNLKVIMTMIDGWKPEQGSVVQFHHFPPISLNSARLISLA